MLAERLEFLGKTRLISPGGSGLGRLPLGALINKLSEGSGLVSSTWDSSLMVSYGAGSGSNS
jgi:hypothetical protein